MDSSVKVANESLPSPVSSPAETGSKQVEVSKITLASSPSRKVRNQQQRCTFQLLTDFRQVRKVVSYAESSEDDEPFTYGGAKARRRTRARQVFKDEDEYDEEANEVAEDDGRSNQTPLMDHD